VELPIHVPDLEKNSGPALFHSVVDIPKKEKADLSSEIINNIASYGTNKILLIKSSTEVFQALHKFEFPVLPPEKKRG